MTIPTLYCHWCEQDALPYADRDECWVCEYQLSPRPVEVVAPEVSDTRRLKLTRRPVLRLVEGKEPA